MTFSGVAPTGINHSAETPLAYTGVISTSLGFGRLEKLGIPQKFYSQLIERFIVI